MANEANQADVGFKIAKQFFDVNTAGDADLILNSSWPSLQVVYEITVPVDISVISSTTMEWKAIAVHNLNYPPFMSAWAIYSDGTSQRLLGIEKITGAHSMNISNTTADVSNSYDSSTVTFTMTHVHFKFYNVDLSKNVEYPVIKASQAKQTTDTDFGIKLVKEGKDINSTDMRDFILHSRCQSPLVLAVKTEESAVGQTITYVNPYSTPVWMFGYIKTSDKIYRYAPLYNQSYPRAFINNNNTYTITWQGTDIGATLFMLRDPIFSGTEVVAKY